MLGNISIAKKIYITYHNFISTTRSPHHGLTLQAAQGPFHSSTKGPIVRASERMYSSLSEKIVRTFVDPKGNGLTVAMWVKNEDEHDDTNQSLTETYVILKKQIVE